MENNNYDYDRAFELKLKENKKYFDLFEKHMRDEGLSERVINRHLKNVDFYVNHFINHYEIYDMNKGCYELDTYFGPYYSNLKPYFTKYTLNENISAIKKFYKLMHENNYVSNDDYDNLLSTIRICKDEWLDLIEGNYYV